MNTEKLSRAQLRTLDKLREKYKDDARKSHSAYELGESLSTLNALRSKGLIVRTDNGIGSSFYPRSCITFRYCPDKSKGE
jgi:hypothetical protein